VVTRDERLALRRLRDRASRQRLGIDGARFALEDALAAGPRVAAEVWSELRAAGFGSFEISRAAAELLGISQSAARSRSGVWSLSAAYPPAAARNGDRCEASLTA
jgi:hypothetical protein